MQILSFVAQSERENIKKAKEIEKEAQKKVNESYWEEHASEKKALEAERATLEEKKQALDMQISKLEEKKRNVPARVEYEEHRKKLSELEAKLGSLGLFKGKEKKALNAEIEVEKSKRSDIDSRVHSQEAEVNSELAPVRKQRSEAVNRISEIDKEFKKDR